MLLALHTFPGSLHPFIWNSREISQQPKFLSWWNFVHTLGNANLLKKKKRSGAGEVEFLRSTGMVQWEQHTQGTGWTSWSQRYFSNLENAGILCWSTGNTSPGEGRAAIPPWAGENWWISVGKPKIPHQERRSAAAPVEIVDVGFTSSNQERLKSKLILVLFGCFFFSAQLHFCSVKIWAIQTHVGFVWLFFSAQLHFCCVKIRDKCSCVSLMTLCPSSSSSSSQVCSSSFTGYFLFRFMLSMVPVELNGLKCIFQPQSWGFELNFLGLCDQEWAKPQAEEPEPWGRISSASPAPGGVSFINDAN